MAEPIRILVVDDSSFMRGALVRMIERDPRCKVIDTAANGREGVEKAKALRPDVITMDVEMPEMNGIDALREIMATVKTPVLMVSTLTEAGAKTTIEALELGAVDFIPKAFGDKERSIFRGGETLHEKLLAAAGVSSVGAAAPAPKPITPITPARGPKPTRVAAKAVVIGSSTGGPKALQVVLRALPKNLPVPVLVAQHMPAQFTLALANRLNETCAIEVAEAKAGDMPVPGKAYIAQGGMNMRLMPDGIHIDEDKGESVYHPSVDVLADSVRAVHGNQVLAVMLTGMGNDGTRAYVELKRAGAYVLAQDAATSVVYGMPKAVYEAGAVDEVLSLDEIGARVAGLVTA